MPRHRRTKPSTFTEKDVPSCSGPKLPPFYCRNKTIHWGERLDGGDGADGFVFRVRIDDESYALKVVGTTYSNAAADM